MIPYELGLGILVLALGSTFNAAFADRRWLSFLCLSLSAFGISGLASTEPIYSQFFSFCPQVIILFAVAVFYCQPKQRIFLAILCSALLVGFVLSETSGGDYLDKALSRLGLYSALVLLPTLIFNVNQKDLEKVDLLISIQQFWLRISLLAWCRENIVNIHHYEIYADYLQAGTLIAGAFLLARFILFRSTWMLTVKSLLSGILFMGALTMEKAELKLLLAWVLVVALIDILPVDRNAKVLKRMNLGGFGGASFLGMALFVMIAPMDPWVRLGWIVLVSIVSYGAFVLPIPEQEIRGPSKQVLAVMFFSLLVQAAFFAVLLFWPELKQLGV